MSCTMSQDTIGKNSPFAYDIVGFNHIVHDIVVLTYNIIRHCWLYCTYDWHEQSKTYDIVGFDDIVYDIVGITYEVVYDIMGLYFMSIWYTILHS
jgi:hypothetical protein